MRQVGKWTLLWVSLYIVAISLASLWQKGEAQVPTGGIGGGLGITTGQFCGATSTCSATNISATLKVVSGSAPLVSGTPSTVTITGISPAFTSTSSFACVVSDNTTQANPAKVAIVSTSSITITGIATNTDVVSYICAGN